MNFLIFKRFISDCFEIKCWVIKNDATVFACFSSLIYFLTIFIVTSFIFLGIMNLANFSEILLLNLSSSWTYILFSHSIFLLFVFRSIKSTFISKCETYINLFNKSSLTVFIKSSSVYVLFLYLYIYFVNNLK